MGRTTQEVLVARLAAFERELTELKQRVIDLERTVKPGPHQKRRWPADAPPVPAAKKGHISFGILDKGGQRELATTSPIINIGSGKSCTLILDDDKVARMHAVIEREAEVILMDLGTDGGTFVNETRLKRAVLKSGDLIKFGNAQVIIVF